MPSILLAHARGEEPLAERVAGPLTDAGYEVIHGGTVLVGESLVQEASIALAAGSPVVLCGTVKALGTGWAHQVVNAARAYPGIRVFALQMEEDVYLKPLALDDIVAAYWQDPARAVSLLIQALEKYYPLGDRPRASSSGHLERRYRELALRSYDIVDLANLPVTDRNLATRELLLRSLYVALRLSVEVDEGLRESPDSLTLPLRDPTEQNRRWSVGERLAAANRLVVLGDPGAGKSTLLRWMATAYLLRLSADPDWSELPDVSGLPAEDWLPVLVRCRDLEDPAAASSLEQVLIHHLRKLGITSGETTQLTNFLLDRLSAGRVLLLIDGLDEISHAGTRARFCRQIEQFYIAYPHAPMVVTSRIVGYREMGLRIGRGFEHTTVLDLTRADKDDFARRWCAVTEPATRQGTAEKELIRDIHSTDRIERLTGNPMLLTTMALVKKKVGKLPSKRGDLYREAVNVLLNWRSDVDELLDPYEALPQLQYIAYAMCAAGVQQLREDEIVRLLSRMRRDLPSVRAARNHEPLEFLRLLERRTGILIEVGKVRHAGRLVPAYEFRHLTFQEYLAGLALAQGRFPGRDRKKTLAQNISPLVVQVSSSDRPPREYAIPETAPVSENWREALRLCIMSLPDDDVDSALLAISDVPLHEDASVTARPRAILALSCLADEPNVSENVATTLIDRFSKVVQVGDGDLGSGASESLAEAGASLWATPLARQIAHQWISRSDEATELGSAIGSVMIQGVPDEEAGSRDWLVEQKQKLASSDSVDQICAALSVMTYAYTFATDENVNYSARSGITHSGLLRLLNLSGREADAAAWAIGWLAGNHLPGRTLWRLTGRQADEIILAITNPHSSSLVKRFLLWTFPTNDAKTEKLAQALASAIERSADLHEMREFSETYKQACHHYLDPITRLLTLADESICGTAADILGDIGNIHAIESLGAVLTTPDGQVRIPVAVALGKLGDHRATEPLIAVLTTPDGQVRHSVVKALSTLNDPRATEPLIAVLTTPDGQVRDSVLDALGELRDSRATEALRKMMAGPAADARSTALWTLARSEGDELKRIMLSRDLDGLSPGIDPAEEITRENARLIASRASVDLDEVLRQFEQLQGRYGLKLSWKAQSDDS